MQTVKPFKIPNQSRQFRARAAYRSSKYYWSKLNYWNDPDFFENPARFYERWKNVKPSLIG